MTSILPRRTLSAPHVGQKAAFTRTLTEVDSALFIGVTWDVNPYHTDDSFAGQSRFGRRIVPGLLTASLMTHLGGLWAFLATEMHFEYRAPVYFGDTVTAEVEIVEVEPATGAVRLSCRCVNAAGVEVLRGWAHGFPGPFDDGDGG